MKPLLKYLREYRVQSVLAPLFKCLEAVMELCVPLIVKEIIDRGIPDGDRGFILSRGLILVGLALLGLLFSVTAQYFAARSAYGFGTALRRDLLRKIDSFSYPELDRIGTSTLHNRLVTDVTRVQDGVNLFLRLFLRSPFIVLGALVLCFREDARIGWICLASVPFLGAAIWAITAYGLPRLTEAQAKLDRVSLLTRENLTGVRVVRAFSREERSVREFAGANEELKDLNLSAGRVSALLNPLTLVMVDLVIVTILRQGGARVEAGLLTRGAVVALVNYMTQILTELLRVADLCVSLTKALSSAGRVTKIFETDCSLPEGSVTDAPERGTVAFEHVSARYHEGADEVLSDLSFRVEAGQRIGLIGGTGEGKSTLINLIPRFYDVSGGRVTVDGTDVRDFTREALCRRVTVVPQQAFLFSGTVRENLLMGRGDATDEELREALARARALDFVEAKEGGLDAAVERGGANFSGGQRQRLCIARALCARPEILILDDSFSALDALTDREIRRTLREELGGVTVITVSQRVSAVRDCDRILVLEDGRLAGEGTHEELLRGCPVYREICESQGAAAGREAADD